MTTTAPTFFVTGGTLPRDAVSYIERDTDSALYKSLLQAEFCYILTSRQMGKSSVMVRTAARLRDAGMRIAVIDLTALGNNLTLEQWYNGLLNRIGHQLHLEDELEDFWDDHTKLPPLERWMTALETVVLPHSPEPIVIFLDEIDLTRSLPFATDEFFAALRSCYNRRDSEPEWKRITFCLLGVVSPSELIQDVKMTPFNIGQRIELRDFTLREAGALAVGIQMTGRHGQDLLERILYWTGGHPYLTQRLCAAVAEDANVIRPEDVDRLCERLFFQSEARQSESNLSYVGNWLLKSEEDVAGLLDLYQRVYSRSGRIADNPVNSLYSTLRLSGIVRVSNGYLRVRNRIYERVFDRQWVRANMPDAELQRQRAAYRKGLLRAISLSSTVVLIMAALTIYAFQQRNQARALASANGRLAYLGNIGIIPDAWEKKNINYVKELLSDTGVSKEIQEVTREAGEIAQKERRFEWGYWNRLCHLDLITLEEQASATLPAPTPSDVAQAGINSVAIAPDSKRIVTSSMNSRVAQVWDITTRRVVLELAGHIGMINSVVFSPDGKRIATSGTDNLAKIWDANTRRDLLTLTGHTDQVIAIAFSPDGKYVVTGGGDKTARVWNAQTGQLLHTLTGHTAGVEAVVFSPDGKRIVTGSDDKTAKVWDADTGHPLLTLQGHGAGIASVAFSPNGKSIVTGSDDYTAMVWNASTGQPMRTLKGHTDDVHSVAYSPDGKRIVTGSFDNTAKVWDADTGKESFTLKGHTSGVNSVACSSDGAYIVTGSFDNTIKIWDAHEDKSALTFRGHAYQVRAAAFSPDGKTIVTGSMDKTAKLWDAGNGHILHTFQGHTDQVRAVAFSPDGKTIATGSNDSTARVWDIATGNVVCTMKGHTAVIKSIAFSPDGKRIVTGSDDHTAKLWDPGTGQLLHTLDKHTDGVWSVAFSPDGKRIVTGSLDTTTRIWDAATGQEIRPPIQGQQRDVYSPNYSSIYAVAFSPDGKWIITGGYDKTAKIWDAATGHLIRTLKGHTDAISSLALSSDGTRLVTGSTDKTAKLWDTQTGRELLTLKGHTDIVVAVAFSADGKRIVTTGNDNTAIVYYAE